MKKPLLTIAVLALSVFLLTGCSRNNQASSTPTPSIKPTASPTPPETQLPPEERPVVNMRTDQQVHHLYFTIENLPADVSKVEYTATYKTNDLERGGFGIYETGQKKEEDFLFGSESSGVFKYDSNVNDIVLTLQYTSQGQKILLRYPYTPSE